MEKKESRMERRARESEEKRQKRQKRLSGKYGWFWRWWGRFVKLALLVVAFLLVKACWDTMTTPDCDGWAEEYGYIDGAYQASGTITPEDLKRATYLDDLLAKYCR